MSVIASLLLITALSIPTNTLVLRSGERILVDGLIQVDGEHVLFNSGGGFYSVDSADVDFDASQQTIAPASAASPLAGRSRLRGTPEERERLLKDLETNHSGTPAPASALNVVPGPTPAERAQMSQDEWSWRYQAQSYEEALQQAKENLDLLRTRAEQLKERIVGLLALGFKPESFTYDSTMLAYTQNAIPSAELEVTRAERAWDQFRDDARRQGIMPGWLRYRAARA